MSILPAHREMLEAPAHGMQLLYDLDPTSVDLGHDLVVPSVVKGYAQQSGFFASNRGEQPFDFTIGVDELGRPLEEVGHAPAVGLTEWSDWYYGADGEPYVTLAGQYFIDGREKDTREVVIDMVSPDLWQVEDIDGRALRIERSANPAGSEWLVGGSNVERFYLYDDSGLLQQSTLTVGKRPPVEYSYAYDGHGRLVEVQETPGSMTIGITNYPNVTTFEYRSVGDDGSLIAEFVGSSGGVRHLGGKVVYDRNKRPTHVSYTDGPVDLSQTFFSIKAEYDD